VSGGYLVQSRDNGVVDDLDLKVVTRRAPTDHELADLKFAFRVCKHVKSNAIVYVKDGATVGIGAGQMSRVDSARIAARKAEDAAEAAGLPEPLARGSVVASDAFFPFADGLLSRRRGRRHRGHPARRLHARRRGHRRRRRSRPRHGLHRHAPLPPLTGQEHRVGLAGDAEADEQADAQGLRPTSAGSSSNTEDCGGNVDCTVSLSSYRKGRRAKSNPVTVTSFGTCAG
jgi:hypothetical protein